MDDDGLMTDQTLTPPHAGVGGAVDLSGYFGRIGYHGSTAPTLATLQALVLAHETHIPFENLNPLMGIPVADLSVPALSAKMVRRRRGGYCFEQNSLLAAALTQLGYGVETYTGRVVFENPAALHGDPSAQTHMVLGVRIPGVDERYLVDVGFGGATPTAPLRLELDDVQETPHQRYRMLAAPNDYEDRIELQTLIRDQWQPMYTFTTTVRPPIDLLMGSWYVSTYPESIFVVGLSASLVTADARWNLRGRHLRVHHIGGGTEHIRFENASGVLDALMNRFGIDVGGLGDVHARITAVLDS